ncbi:MAG TPA: hypothetical protein VFC19_28915 [Candidatus Limnocylindrales bacterium]|nr:hypothetical protein [Candidatus Limnocylindrales bacterium]
MENDPVYRQLPAMPTAREGRMPPRDDRVDWGLWVVVLLILIIGAAGGWLIWIVIMVSEINESIG